MCTFFFRIKLLCQFMRIKYLSHMRYPKNINNVTSHDTDASDDIHLGYTSDDIHLGLTQIHNEPTRYGNMLDLVFTNNPSLVKSSYSVPGISDHAMVVTDLDIHPKCVTQKPRKIYIYSNQTGIQ